MHPTMSNPNRLPISIALAVMLAASAAAQTWEDITANLPSAPKLGTGQSLASTGGDLYVLTSPNGVLRSSDNGATWTSVLSIAGNANNLAGFTSRSIDAVGTTVWAGGEPGSLALTGGVLPLHRLTGAATAWTPSFAGAVPPSVIDAVAYDASTATHWAAGRLGGIFKSTDGGSTWAAANGNLPGTNCASLVARNGTVIAAILGNGMGAFTSTDGGATWTNNGVPLSSIGFLAAVGSKVCVIGDGATTATSGVYFSEDFGLTWQFSQVDIAGGAKILKNTCADSTTLFSGGMLLYTPTFQFVRQATVAFSLNGGATWDDLPTAGLPAGVGKQVERIARHGNFIYALTGDSRLYRLDLGALTLAHTLKVTVPPKIDKRLTGDTLTMRVYAGGPGTLTYQWKKDGVDVPGQTSATLSIANAQPSDTGNYTCVVTAGGSSITSAAARGTVVDRVEGRYDPTYSRTNLAGGETGTPFLQSDGSVIVLTSGGVYKVGPDGGKTDSRAIGGTTGYYARWIDASGRILLGGIQGNSTTHRLRRLLGSTGFADDTTFPQIAANNTIRTVVELPGKGYLISGDFSTLGPASGTQVSVPRLVLVGYDGNLDTAFNTAMQTIVGGQANTPYVTPDAKIWILVGGGFKQVDANGAPVAGFTDYAPVTSTNYVSSAALLKSGKMLVTLATSSNRPLRMINANGTFDTTFNTAGLALNNVFGAATEQADGKIIIAGNFTSFGSNACNGRYLRMTADGVFDGTFYNATGFSTAGCSGMIYDPRGYILMANSANATTGSFQDSATIGDTIGQNFVRVFATAAPVGPDTSFAGWAAQYQFPAGLSGLHDDADGDGLSNLLEYALSTDPTGAANSPGPQSGEIVTINAQQYPTIRFTRNLNATGITVTVEVSATLPFGTDLGSTLVSATDLGDGSELLVYRSSVSFSAQPNQFLRVRVTMP